MALLTGWRIAHPRFSSSPTQMLSGLGASQYGGRWNSPGTLMVYLGSTLSIAALELLANLDAKSVLDQYNRLQVQFPPEVVRHYNIDDLPDNWAAPTMASSVQEAGDNWAKSMDSLILQVPSAIIPSESNFLLNPIHPDIGHLVFGDISPFRFDPRLLKSE